MDWQLLGLTSLFVTPGLLGVLVGLLGFTRTEKLLVAAFFTGFAAVLIMINVFRSLVVADLHTKAEVDSWLARIHIASKIANGIEWFCFSVLTAFCAVALVHIWRERSTLWNMFRVKT